MKISLESATVLLRSGLLGVIPAGRKPGSLRVTVQSLAVYQTTGFASNALVGAQGQVDSKSSFCVQSGTLLLGIKRAKPVPDKHIKT